MSGRGRNSFRMGGMMMGREEKIVRKMVNRIVRKRVMGGSIVVIMNLLKRLGIESGVKKGKGEILGEKEGNKG